MEIYLEGLFPKGIVDAARKGKISPYAICGVDLYLRQDIAARDNVNVDLERPCKIDGEMFFSSRHYRVLHILDEDNYDPQSTIEELKAKLVSLEAKVAGIPTKEITESIYVECAYVLTPLTEYELKELER